jgi:glycerol-3-phosphate dehydrogenase
VLILGGGIAGLWTLDELRRRGFNCLLVERTALGDGQTIWSQGIIHGGLKYTLAGLMNPAAESIREMPAVWRACLAGTREPDLSGAPLRADHCHLWQTASLASRVGMIGARAGLRVAPVMLEKRERPPPLRDCPGVVARLDEQVIDPAAVLRVLAARHAGFIVRADATCTLSNAMAAGPSTKPRNPLVTCHLDSGARSLTLAARHLILAAGGGNAALRASLGFAPRRTQVRPLRMTLVRSPTLPILNGHCVDGAKTRLTITSARDAGSRTVWQIGGDLAERGVSVSPAELIRFARSELLATLPGLDLSRAEFAIYDAPRAEAATGEGVRPDDAAVIEEGPVLTLFPTKLALAPRAAEMIARHLENPTARHFSSGPPTALSLAPVFDPPPVATPPWEAAMWSSA